MYTYISRILEPVKREGAERYLLLVLVSFASSVIAIRLYLTLTGYPQFGSGVIQIAHVLWGGLFLFVAALLPLVFANRWAYSTGALLCGVGVGLFIDEVGKFITRTNDYFYQPAAPIIYAFFLLTVLLYIKVRRPPSQDVRTRLYRILDGLAEVLDHDLDPQERAQLEKELHQVSQQAEHPNYARLSKALLTFLSSDELQLAHESPRLWDRWVQKLTTWQSSWVTQKRLKIILILGLTGLGLATFTDSFLAIGAIFSPSYLQNLIDELVAIGIVSYESHPMWFVVRLALQGIFGWLMLLAARDMLQGNERRGLALAYYGLLMSLTTINLLVFYFAQFRAILDSVVQFGFLLGILHYRQFFLLEK